MANLIVGERPWAWFYASYPLSDPGQKRGSQKSQEATVKSPDKECGEHIVGVS